MPEKPYFEEKQYFRSPWMWGVLIITTFVVWKSFFQLIRNPEILQLSQFYQFFLLATFFLCGMILPVLFWIAYLKLIVTDTGIWYQYVPFQLKRRFIALNRIEHFEKITYRPLIDYGGWGIRYGRKGMAYTVSGNQGIQIVFNTGRKLILGSQQTDAFENAIRLAMQDSHQKTRE